MVATEDRILWGDIWHSDQYKNKDNYIFAGSDFQKGEQIKSVDIG